MSAFYNTKVIDHFKHPRNVGVITNADAMGYAGHPSLGMDAELYLKVENGLVIAARSKSFGCGATIAVGSAVTEMITGKRIDEIAVIAHSDVDLALGGLPPSKSHCAAFGRELIQSAVKNYSERHKGV
jgi:nitrogen fixation NifU-like protein